MLLLYEITLGVIGFWNQISPFIIEYSENRYFLNISIIVAVTIYIIEIYVYIIKTIKLNRNIYLQSIIHSSAKLFGISRRCKRWQDAVLIKALTKWLQRSPMTRHPCPMVLRHVAVSDPSVLQGLFPIDWLTRIIFSNRKSDTYNASFNFKKVLGFNMKCFDIYAYVYREIPVPHGNT